MASCSFLASFIMLSLCTAASLPARERSLSCSLSVQLASHPHVWVTSCVRCFGTLQPPSSLPHCHIPNTQTSTMSRYRRGSAIDGTTPPTTHPKSSF